MSPSVSLCLYVFLFLSLCLCLFLFMTLSLSMSACLSVCLSVSLSIFLCQLWFQMITSHTGILQLQSLIGEQYQSVRLPPTATAIQEEDSPSIGQRDQCRPGADALKTTTQNVLNVFQPLGGIPTCLSPPVFFKVPTQRQVDGSCGPSCAQDAESSHNNDNILHSLPHSIPPLAFL